VSVGWDEKGNEMVIEQQLKRHDDENQASEIDDKDLRLFSSLPSIALSAAKTRRLA
jgi:hypothetical protein